MVGEEGFEPSAPVTRLLPDGSGHLCYQGLRRLSQRAASCLNQPINVEYGAHMVPAPSRQHSAECLLSYRLEPQLRLGRDGTYLVCDAQLQRDETSPQYVRKPRTTHCSHPASFALLTSLTVRLVPRGADLVCVRPLTF